MTKEEQRQPYRPSNGTEGEIFIGQWCSYCEAESARRNDPDADGCDIVMWTMALGIDHPDYPPEWIIAHGAPRCTAFRYVGDDAAPDMPLDPNSVVRPLL